MTNITEIEEEESNLFPQYSVILISISTAITITLALIGNALTVVSYFRDRQLRNIYNLFITNLACTDFLLGLISMPFYAVYTASSYAWPFGEAFCKIYMTTDFTLCMESILMMIILSWDRVLLLRNGTGYTVNVTKKKAIIAIVFSWLIAFLVYGPAILFYDVITGENNVEEGDCDVQFANDFTFTLITAVLEFVLPFITLCVLNFYIYFQIRKRIRLHSERSAKKKKTLAQNQRSIEVNPGRSGENDQQPAKNSTDKRDVKAAKNLAILMVVFLVTWAPYTITTIIISACADCVDEDFYEFLNWLLWSKAAMNPFLYAFNNPRFRQNFLSLLFCFKPCKRRNKTKSLATTESTVITDA